MFKNISADLKRYVRAKEDCSSTITYFLQFIPIILLHEGAICMIGYRLASWLYRKGIPIVPNLTSKIFFFLTGNWIHPESRIGPGCKINHSGVAIHADIGKGLECTMSISIGPKMLYDLSHFPVIGDYVVIGAGARVFSDVGNEVIIGANAVVLKPVKDGKIVVGIPAEEAGSSDEFMRYYKSLFKGI